MRFFHLIAFLFASACAAALDSPFDAHRLQTGKFVYRDTKDGQVIGTFTLTITANRDGTYLFTGDAEGFHQHWKSVAQASFTPLSAELRIVRDNGQPYDMDVNYSGGIAHGTVTRGPSPAKSSERPVTPDTVDQRIDWAAMLSARLAAGDELKFHVYDPDSGLTAVTGKAIGLEKITVPAGHYEALRLHYRMDKPDGPEAYDILVTQTFPRLMIREEFPDGTVTDLIEASVTGN